MRPTTSNWSAGVSRSAAGRTLAEATGVEVDGRVHASVAEALAAAPVDVLVDYTSATAVKENAEAAVDAGVHVVIGSSGLPRTTTPSWTNAPAPRASESSPPATSRSWPPSSGARPRWPPSTSTTGR